MQQVWRKRMGLTAWIALGAITLVLLVSAVSKKNHKLCAGVEVSFNEDGNNFFVDEKGVVAILKTFGSIKGEEIKNINLQTLEARLKNDRWIANAELFFDNKQVLQVIIEEKQPVARLFTVAGGSFYIDSACRKLPLSEKLSARIPMFTSFPSDRANLSRPDSELLASVKDLAMFIQADEFWKAQVAQVDITPEGFEMIPTVGNHVVALGNNGDWQKKFDRLYSFYKQVWTKVGFEKYEKLDVQYNGQVVATIKGSGPAKVDSAGVRKAYENLLKEIKNSTVDSALAVATPIKSKTAVSVEGTVSEESRKTDKALAYKQDALREAPKKESQKQPLKAEARRSASSEIASAKEEEEKRIPKAIMKKRTEVTRAEKKGK